MSQTDKANTLLVINLDSLITGDKLYFHSGVNTPKAVAEKTRDRALKLAKRLGIHAAINNGHSEHYPQGNGCCSAQMPFDAAKIPVLTVEASNGSLSKKRVINKRIKQRNSLQEPVGISRSMITFSIWTSICRDESKLALVTA